MESTHEIRSKKIQVYLHPFSKISVYVIKKRQGVRSLNKYTFESKFMYSTVYKIVSDPVDSGLKDPDTTFNWYTRHMCS